MRKVLEMLSRGEITITEAEAQLRMLAIQEVGSLARLDNGREMRKGIPEVLLAEGKSPEAVRDIALKCLNQMGRVIISRASGDQIETLRQALPTGACLEGDSRMRTAVLRRADFSVEKTGGRVGILTAGTSDIPIAEEVRIMAREMGCDVWTAYDVGVAGIHRIFEPLKQMIQNNVDMLVIVAGREGALATVVAGLVDIPIIGVPTSFSWGLGEKGLSALISMLQSCPLGLTVVNIDGGIAAGAAAALMANRVAAARKTMPVSNVH